MRSQASCQPVGIAQRAAAHRVLLVPAPSRRYEAPAKVVLGVPLRVCEYPEMCSAHLLASAAELAAADVNADPAILADSELELRLVDVDFQSADSIASASDELIAHQAVSCIGPGYSSWTKLLYAVANENDRHAARIPFIS